MLLVFSRGILLLFKSLGYIYTALVYNIFFALSTPKKQAVVAFFGCPQPFSAFIPPYGAPTHLQHTIYAFYAEKIIFQQKKKAHKDFLFWFVF